MTLSRVRSPPQKKKKKKKEKKAYSLLGASVRSRSRIWFFLPPRPNKEQKGILKSDPGKDQYFVGCLCQTRVSLPEQLIRDCRHVPYQWDQSNGNEEKPLCKVVTFVSMEECCRLTHPSGSQPSNLHRNTASYWKELRKMRELISNCLAIVFIVLIDKW